jgi:hypothetical protein
MLFSEHRLELEAQLVAVFVDAEQIGVLEIERCSSPASWS